VIHVVKIAICMCSSSSESHSRPSTHTYIRGHCCYKHTTAVVAEMLPRELTAKTRKLQLPLLPSSLPEMLLLSHLNCHCCFCLCCCCCPGCVNQRATHARPPTWLRPEYTARPLAYISYVTHSCTTLFPPGALITVQPGALLGTHQDKHTEHPH
jgi:hypothetical protein